MSILEWSGNISIIGGAILVTSVLLVKLVWNPMRKALIREMKKELTATNAVFKTELDTQLKPILKLVSQLEQNGGSHLADRLVRVEERQSSIGQRMDDIYDLVKAKG